MKNPPFLFWEGGFCNPKNMEEKEYIEKVKKAAEKEMQRVLNDNVSVEIKSLFEFAFIQGAKWKRNKTN